MDPSVFQNLFATLSAEQQAALLRQSLGNLTQQQSSGSQHTPSAPGLPHQQQYDSRSYGFSTPAANRTPAPADKLKLFNYWKNATQHYKWLKDMASRSGMPNYYACLAEDHEWTDDEGNEHTGPDQESAWKLLVACGARKDADYENRFITSGKKAGKYKALPRLLRQNKDIFDAMDVLFGDNASSSPSFRDLGQVDLSSRDTAIMT
ncbi:hypothetical protein WJX73_002776 [Symbiochloris irregularis]|uniref:Uncharacterized protein n=1 Tax=Symbiochloris irregularis TaxID=706552 RepID=A0AAW1P4E5_9CHLO